MTEWYTKPLTAPIRVVTTDDCLNGIGNLEDGMTVNRIYNWYFMDPEERALFLKPSSKDYQTLCTNIAVDFLHCRDVDKTMKKTKSRLRRHLQTRKQDQLMFEILQLVSLPEAKCVIPELLKIGILPIVMLIWQQKIDCLVYQSLCMEILYKIMSQCNVKSFETEWHLFLGFSDPLPGTSSGEDCSALRVLEMHLEGEDDFEMDEKLLNLNMDEFANDMVSRIIVRPQHCMLENHTWYSRFMRCVNQLHLLFSNPDLQAENSLFLRNFTPSDCPELADICKKYEDQYEDIRRNILLADLISDEPASECHVLVDLAPLHRKQWFLPVLEQDLEKVFCDGPSVETCLLHHDFAVLHSARTLFYLTNSLQHAMDVANFETNSLFNHLLLSQNARYFVCVYTCDLEHVQGRKLIEGEDFDTMLLLMRDSAEGMEEDVDEKMTAELARCQDLSYLIAEVSNAISPEKSSVKDLAIRNNADSILNLEKVYCFHAKGMEFHESE